MTFVDWLGVAVALSCLIVLPLLERAERRQRARDLARWEELKEQVREHYAAEIAQAARSKQAPAE